MADLIEFDPVDTIAVGALGRPGQRRFVVQAVKNGALLCVLVEKQQLALLSSQIGEFLDTLGPAGEGRLDAVDDARCGEVVESEPLFRALLMGIGFDRDRGLVLLELREMADEDEDGNPIARDDAEGHVARLYATAAQMHAISRHGLASVARGRPPCPLCEQPLDPDGHVCPRLN
jgi:uncharacterized repeat protein (TIGR03847 family)